jgi:hypothetical protein
MAKTKNESKPNDATEAPPVPANTEPSSSAPAAIVFQSIVPDAAVAELNAATSVAVAAIEDVAAKAEAMADSVAVAPRELWRTIALATRPCTVAFSLGCVSYLGGEIEEDPARVAVLRTLEGFEFIELEHPSDLDRVRASLTKEVDDLTRRAQAIGYKLVRQGVRK